DRRRERKIRSDDRTRRLADPPLGSARGYRTRGRGNRAWRFPLFDWGILQRCWRFPSANSLGTEEKEEAKRAKRSKKGKKDLFALFAPLRPFCFSPCIMSKDIDPQEKHCSRRKFLSTALAAPIFATELSSSIQSNDVSVASPDGRVRFEI